MTAEDLAGLDAEEVGLLLANERALNQNIAGGIANVVSERNRRQKIAREEQIRQEAIKAAVKERQRKMAAEEQKRRDALAKEERTALRSREAADLDYQRKVEFEKLKRDLDAKAAANEPITEADKLKLRKLELEVKAAEKALEQGTEGLTPYQQFQKQKQLNDLVLDDLAGTAAVDTQGKEIPFEERRVRAIQANNRPENPVYYRISEQVEDAPGVYRFGTDIPGDVQPVQLPRNPRTGKQVTSRDIIDTLRANPNMTEEQLLRQIGAI